VICPHHTAHCSNKIQIATFIGKYASTDKTVVDFEIATSNNDKKIYFQILTQCNKEISARKMRNNDCSLLNGNLMRLIINLQQSFQSVERLYSIE
jgi:hypothetical protein